MLSNIGFFWIVCAKNAAFKAVYSNETLTHCLHRKYHPTVYLKPGYKSIGCVKNKIRTTGPEIITLPNVYIFSPEAQNTLHLFHELTPGPLTLPHRCFVLLGFFSAYWNDNYEYGI